MRSPRSGAMCPGAVDWARPARLVFARTRDDAAAAGFDDAIVYRELALPIPSRSVPTFVLLLDEGSPRSATQSAAGRREY